jgi:hypothetical protein
LKSYDFIHSVKRNQLGIAKAEDSVYVHSNLYFLSHYNPEYKKGPSRMWDVELEISDLNMTLNVMTHLNLLEDLTPSMLPSAATSNILDSSLSNHVVELQYADDEDVDPFQDMSLDLLYIIILVE